MKKSVLIVSACFAVFSLTANELSLSNINRVKVPRAQKIMNKMDKDNDGRISKQEAKGRLIPITFGNKLYFKKNTRKRVFWAPTDYTDSTDFKYFTFLYH